MRHLKTAAFSAGARDLRARTPHIPAFQPVMRGALMPAIRTIRRDLGLSTGDLLVLGALLSFLPCKDRDSGAERPISPDMVLVVFASNSALCDRANGMDERVLRRHLARLCDTGLIRRKQSATGKRFPLKRDGMIRDAFGLDLAPLLERHQELMSMAEETRLKAEELRAVRAEALALRAQALETADPADQEARSFLEQAKTILRRATLTVDRVLELIAAMSRLLAGAREPEVEDPCPVTAPVSGPSEDQQPPAHSTGFVTPSNVREGPRSEHGNVRRRPAEMSGGDGRNVRQQETSQIDIKKRKKPTDMRKLWGRCEYVAIMHPEPPETEEGLLRVIHEFGQLTRFDDRTLAEAVRSIGANRLLEVLDYIAQNANSIRCRYSYLGRIMQRKGASPQGGPRTACLG